MSEGRWCPWIFPIPSHGFMILVPNTARMAYDVQHAPELGARAGDGVPAQGFTPSAIGREKRK